ncbi:MAG: JAB domain-containing protein, partial [Sphingomicrobium sp.]
GGVTFPLRELSADAAVHGSAGLILAYNHPSEDPKLSPDDHALTKRLALIGEAMDVAVLDHFVRAGGQCSSLRATGLI